uniref:Bloodthirsty-related gene family, member 1 n=1 Tax=Xiphophorus couchianus TaxID=32473 RepID=A0A3B5ML83_9TELE
MLQSCEDFLSEEQFLCSICLDVFTDPVTIPCGHNFCKTCITKHWNISRHQQCPLCKEQFDPKPALRINTFISEMASHFRNARSLSGQVSEVTAAVAEDFQSSCDATVRTAAAQLETIRTEMKKLCARIELARVRLYVVDVTLDPNTANPYLVMSDDGKTVRCSDVTQVLPDKPERLSAFGILGKQSFSSGRFYYEVEVKGKTKWELGVVQESIDRKGENAICPENGYWAVWLRNSHYRALTGPSVPLVLVSEPQKVGVFVDYDEGLVSFYDAEAAHLIFSFTSCNFSEKLYPYFSPCPSDGGKNSAPLIISSISHTLN